MKPFRKPAGADYQRPNLDSQIGMAVHMLKVRPKLAGISAHALQCQWNLKPATAERLLAEEAVRRGE
jgi:hypothetical protein